MIKHIIFYNNNKCCVSTFRWIWTVNRDPRRTSMFIENQYSEWEQSFVHLLIGSEIVCHRHDVWRRDFPLFWLDNVIMIEHGYFGLFETCVVCNMCLYITCITNFQLSKTGDRQTSHRFWPRETALICHLWSGLIMS